MKHYNIIITGQVQGVFYRDSARRVAEKLGLTGQASNQPDGSVLIEAEGEASAIDQLVAWCKEGPKHAQVENVQVSQGEIKGYRKFEVEW